ncbi:uncharacterized protein BO66DRAFT_476031 [Aspergillus aculeatinus CBS 121060]|uniref:Uncharacterized protein n=1 Tax=Aspergillus aculeatinus CBS 121060 TaxID=1448322 RepID=A0ACD1GRU2_9EURO|nr:hypothetical protein BO66DRAFT_476031 [Aspergillus aculeatinus CBS 121060]RAH64135.1 hypothetical protein BO66DRAFT_476031 [Aspergillus aculeatinus CBS 121060]
MVAVSPFLVSTTFVAPLPQNGLQVPIRMYAETQIGRAITVNNHEYTIVDVLSEKSNMELHERWVVYEATVPHDTRRCALKVRYQIAAKGVSERDLISEEIMARRCFEDECQALQDCQVSVYFPNYYGCAELPGAENPLKDGGHVWVIAMGLAGGTSVVEMPGLGHMRLKGWGFFMQETEQIFFDPGRRLICIVGLSRAGRDGVFPPPPENRITRNHRDVLAFGMGWWRE